MEIVLNKKLYADDKYHKLVAHVLHGTYPGCYGCGCPACITWQDTVEEFVHLFYLDDRDFDDKQFWNWCYSGVKDVSKSN